MMVAGGEKERGQGEKKKKPYSSRRLPEKQSPDRLKHVCICQHLAVTTSCICQISQHAKQKEATLCEVLICWLLQRNNFWNRCNLTSCALPLTFKVFLKIFSKLRFTSILRFFMLNWIKAVCININKLQNHLSSWKLYPQFYLVLDYFLKAKYKVCKNKKFSRRGRHSTSLSEFLK